MIGSHQALHYDQPSHQITVSPARNIDAILKDKKVLKKSKPKALVFEQVSDISISSHDNIVIGECMDYRLIEDGGRRFCEMRFDDFGTEILVRFSFARMHH